MSQLGLSVAGRPGETLRWPSLRALPGLGYPFEMLGGIETSVEKERVLSCRRDTRFRDAQTGAGSDSGQDEHCVNEAGSQKGDG